MYTVKLSGGEDRQKFWGSTQKSAESKFSWAAEARGRTLTFPKSGKVDFIVHSDATDGPSLSSLKRGSSNTKSMSAFDFMKFLREMPTRKKSASPGAPKKATKKKTAKKGASKKKTQSKKKTYGRKKQTKNKSSQKKSSQKKMCAAKTTLGKNCRNRVKGKRIMCRVHRTRK